MTEATPAHLLWLALATGVVAAVLTWIAMLYARERALLDPPGRRRSHALPTPRGGGVGPLVAWLAALPLASLARTPYWVLALGVLAVAAVGFADDHRPLPAWPRLLVHLLTASVLAATVMGIPADRHGWALVAAAVLALAALVNFWNFMDGIDGLAGVQTAFVTAVLAGMAAWHGQALLSGAALTLCAATAGFLPFNFPRARVFLGDVGSGGLGFAVAGLLLVAVTAGALSPLGAALLCSAFVVDAGMTLLWRLLGGRRWYHPHREHLYQWLVRCGIPHAKVVGLYMTWNILIVLPVVVLTDTTAVPAMLTAGPAMALAVVLWLLARRRVLADVRGRART
ncbi:MAG TPA: glycosyltransferase family 4 protein [Xanthomonadaceae bacterium]|nr:glycosyltransferase family 4 protein [Xanthomonadaceae bacterium]